MVVHSQLQHRLEATEALGVLLKMLMDDHVARFPEAYAQHEAFDEAAVESGDVKRMFANASRCPPRLGIYQWHLADVRRIARPRKPSGKPQPVWFEPF